MGCINETERKAHELVSSLNIYFFLKHFAGSKKGVVVVRIQELTCKKTAGVFRSNGLTDGDFQWHQRYFKGQVNQKSVGT